MAKLPQLTAFRTLNKFVDLLLKGTGYRYEIRRAGELKLGLLRFPLRADSREPRRLVVIPGFGDTPLSWVPVLTPIFPALRTTFDEIVIFDFPGFHGFLQQERSFESLDLLFQVSADVLDSLKPHTVAGHSLGGWIAAHYATCCGTGERPLRATSAYSGPERIVLMDPAGVFGEESEKAAWRLRFQEGIEKGFSAFRAHLFKKEPFFFRFLAHEFGTFFQREDILAFMVSVRDDHEVKSRLSSVRAETWLLWGEEDSLSPVKWVKDWLRELPPGRAHAVILPGIGHSLQHECMAVTAILLRRILTGKRPSSDRTRWWRVV